jgi:hypothetical protein
MASAPEALPKHANHKQCPSEYSLVAAICCSYLRVCSNAKSCVCLHHSDSASASTTGCMQHIAPGGTKQSPSELAPMCCVHIPPRHCLTAAAASAAGDGTGTRPVSCDAAAKLMAAAGLGLPALPSQMNPWGHLLAASTWLVFATAVAW